MNNAAPLKNIVFFLCSPSMGILDNWLPVIWRLKEKREDLKFIIIFPKANHVDQIHLSNVLIILAAKIFDCVVFKSHAGHWLYAETFSQVKVKNKLTRLEWFLLRIIKKLKKWPISGLVSGLIQYGYGKLCKFRDRKYLYDWELAEKHGVCILYDVYEESKPFNVDLMKKFREIPKFSIQHGININDGGVLRYSEKLLDGDYRKDIKAYLFSPKECPLYEHQYAIHKSFMKVVGVPRHTPDWMNFIVANISDKMNGLSNDFIFIISRPANTNYHSYERKKKALKAIKRLAWIDLKKKIVVKLHPKEIKEGLYEEVFGNDTYGDKWVYSNLHPFVLGKESAFAISFYSGVVVDMVALGVPTIEYLDLRGIPECDNSESLRDKKGHPVFSFRYLDLVLGASDYDQMKAHAMEIMSDRETVINRLQARYNELFPRIENINEVIAQDILSFVSKKRE
ncbi:MAG: hypothetical protein JXC36_05325 [Candidatus Atribacteria bacterium]|nr:hypothetical protein [Candidatus Atribacteria bacterium]